MAQHEFYGHHHNMKYIMTNFILLDIQMIVWYAAVSN